MSMMELFGQNLVGHLVYICLLSHQIIVIWLADALIKKYEAALKENVIAMDNLNSTLGELQSQLISKDDEIKQLITTQENLEKDKKELQLRNDDFGSKLLLSLEEIKSLESFVHLIAAQLAELDAKKLIFREKLDQLNSLYESCFKLVQNKMDLAAQLAKKRHNKLQSELLFTKSEKDGLQVLNQELNSQVIELQKSHEAAIMQLSEELQISRERIQSLESEAETLVSKSIESELLVCELKQKIGSLLESTKSSEDRMVETIALVILCFVTMLYCCPQPVSLCLTARFAGQVFSIRESEK